MSYLNSIESWLFPNNLDRIFLQYPFWMLLIDVFSLNNSSGCAGLISNKPVLLSDTIFYNQCFEVDENKSHDELRNTIRSKFFIRSAKSKIRDFLVKYFMILEQGFLSPGCTDEILENNRNFEIAIN